MQSELLNYGALLKGARISMRNMNFLGGRRREEGGDGNEGEREMEGGERRERGEGERGR
jgi:hypothetical protein